MTLASPNSCSSDGYFSDVFDCVGEVCVYTCMHIDRDSLCIALMTDEYYYSLLY